MSWVNFLSIHNPIPRSVNINPRNWLSIGSLHFGFGVMALGCSQGAPVSTFGQSSSSAACEPASAQKTMAESRSDTSTDGEISEISSGKTHLLKGHVLLNHSSMVVSCLCQAIPTALIARLFVGDFHTLMTTLLTVAIHYGGDTYMNEGRD